MQLVGTFKIDIDILHIHTHYTNKKKHAQHEGYSHLTLQL